MNRRSFLASSTIFIGGVAQRARAASEPTVVTNSGKLRGAIQEKVAVFKGIPYARAQRFLPPTKSEPWTGVRDALLLGPRSPQLPSTVNLTEVTSMDPREPMSEDCLVLNVWTPSTGAGHKRPVMVSMHGGGFGTSSAGWSWYDGTALAAKHDVVVVTVNHRLNVFGYLHLGDIGGEKYAHASNVGQLDLIAALGWVHDNIGALGGDANNVTIFGCSGGGSKISTLLAMPAAKGLFHRATCESGSLLKATPRDRATRGAEALLAKVGLKAGQLDELQKMPIEKLLAASQGVPGLTLSPVVDGRSLPSDPFDPAAPAISSDVPMLIGSNQTEVTFFAGTPLDPMDDRTLHAQVKQVMRTDDATADQLIATYRRTQPGATNIDLYQIMASDNGQRMSAITQAERKSALGKAPAYMYYFKWRTPVHDGKLKAMHTLQIPFVFDHVDLNRTITGDGTDRQPLADRISRAWVAFARTGNPNHKGIPEWPAYDERRRATMILDQQCKVADDPDKEQLAALKAIRSGQA
jgi:para-nitrobenzyl esterase